jgi:hypothetical protein
LCYKESSNILIERYIIKGRTTKQKPTRKKSKGTSVARVLMVVSFTSLSKCSTPAQGKEEYKFI